MFQSAELGYPTVKQAQAAGANVTTDAQDMLNTGYFPYEA